jgi:hypothetical protein
MPALTPRTSPLALLAKGTAEEIFQIRESP